MLRWATQEPICHLGNGTRPAEHALRRSRASPVQQLPKDTLHVILQAAMRQQGSIVQAWVRLSLVCMDWHAALKGACHVSQPPADVFST